MRGLHFKLCILKKTSGDMFLMCFIAEEVRNLPKLPHEDSCWIRFENQVFYMKGVEYLFLKQVLIKNLSKK